MVKTKEEKKAYKRAFMRVYSQRPEVKARQKVRVPTPEQKANKAEYMKSYSSKRRLNQTPEEKAKQYACRVKYMNSPKGRARIEAYKPKHKARNLQRVPQLLANNKKHRGSARAKMTREKYLNTERTQNMRMVARQKWYATPHSKAIVEGHTKKASAKSRSLPRGYSLYIIGVDTHPGHFKVGRAADPKGRAKNMSAGFLDNYDVLKVYEGFGRYEKLVHKALSPYMVSKPKKKITEWFHLPYEELVEKVNSIISQFEH